jgi:hypothetical protein
MLTHQELPDGIVEIIHTGDLDAEDWQKYQDLVLEILDSHTEKVYILSNFSGSRQFQKNLISQFGTARHLTHPHLGMLTLLGGNALQNFLAKLTELRAAKAHRDSALRIHADRDRALEVLRHYRDIVRQTESDR